VLAPVATVAEAVASALAGAGLIDVGEDDALILQVREAVPEVGICGHGADADIGYDAAVAARSRRDALGNPNAQVAKDQSAEDLLRDDYVVAPLRRHALPPITDGVVAMVLAAGDRARDLCERPAWITGIDHRIEAHALGARDLAQSPSTRLAAQGAGVFDASGDAPGAVHVDVAELHAPFAHQELILRDALGLADSVAVNPSGGALAANALMVAGLVRIGEAAARIMDGSAQTAIAHATSGPCLQQNLVCALAAEPAGPAGKGA